MKLKFKVNLKRPRLKTLFKLFLLALFLFNTYWLFILTVNYMGMVEKLNTLCEIVALTGWWI
jgi:hypothetical protein